jgi:hypothetical protein
MPTPTKPKTLDEWREGKIRHSSGGFPANVASDRKWWAQMSDSQQRKMWAEEKPAAAAASSRRVRRAARKKLKGGGTALSALGGRDLPSPPDPAPAAPPQPTRKVGGGAAPPPPPERHDDIRHRIWFGKPDDKLPPPGGWLQEPWRPEPAGELGKDDKSSAGRPASLFGPATGRYAKRKTPPIDWAKQLKGSK